MLTAELQEVINEITNELKDLSLLRKVIEVSWDEVPLKSRPRISPSFNEGFVPDTIGFFRCTHSPRLHDGLYIYLEKLRSVSKWHNVNEQHMLCYVLLHEVSHMLLHVQLPLNLRRVRIPIEVNLEEAYCEFKAFVALEKGALTIANICIPTRRLNKRSLTMIARLPRPHPYVLFRRLFYLPYKLGFISERDADNALLTFYNYYSRRFRVIKSHSNLLVRNLRIRLKLAPQSLIKGIRLHYRAEKFLYPPKPCTKYNFYLVRGGS